MKRHLGKAPQLAVGHLETGSHESFALKALNAETRAAMAEADEIARAHRARFETATELFDNLEKNSGQ